MTLFRIVFWHETAEKMAQLCLVYNPRWWIKFPSIKLNLGWSPPRPSTQSVDPRIPTPFSPMCRISLPATTAWRLKSVSQIPFPPTASKSEWSTVQLRVPFRWTVPPVAVDRVVAARAHRVILHERRCNMPEGELRYLHPPDRVALGPLKDEDLLDRRGHQRARGLSADRDGKEQLVLGLVKVPLAGHVEELAAVAHVVRPTTHLQRQMHQHVNRNHVNTCGVAAVAAVPQNHQVACDTLISGCDRPGATRFRGPPAARPCQT